MRVSYMGEEQYRLNSLDEIKAWWKDRSYTKQDTESDNQVSEKTEEKKEATIVDPLEAVENKTPK